MNAFTPETLATLYGGAASRTSPVVVEKKPRQNLYTGGRNMSDDEGEEQMNTFIAAAGIIGASAFIIGLGFLLG